MVSVMIWEIQKSRNPWPLNQEQINIEMLKFDN